MAGTPKEPASDSPAGQNRWGRIYASVVGVTVVVILLLYVFTQHYSG